LSTHFAEKFELPKKIASEKSSDEMAFPSVSETKKAGLRLPSLESEKLVFQKRKARKREESSQLGSQLSIPGKRRS